MTISVQKCINFFMMLYIVLFFSFDKLPEAVIFTQVVFCIIVGLVLGKKIIQLQFNTSKYMMGWVLFLVLSLASYFWAIDTTSVVSKFQQLLLLMMLFFVYFQYCENEESIYLLFKTIAVSGALMCLYIIYINGYQTIFSNMAVGVRGSDDQIANLNLTGRLGGYAFISALFFFLQEKFRKKYIWGIIMLLNLLAIIYSGSRGGLIGLCVGVLLLYVHKINRRNFIFMTIGVISIPILLAIFFPDYIDSLIFSRFEALGTVTQGGTADGTKRWLMITHGLNWFLENPLLGHGLFAFPSLFESFYGWYVYAHVDIIEILVDLGIIGLIFYFLPIVLLTKTLYRGYKKNIPLSVLCFTLSCIFLLNSTYGIQVIEKFTYVLMGIVMGYTRLIQNNRGES